MTQQEETNDIEIVIIGNKSDGKLFATALSQNVIEANGLDNDKATSLYKTLAGNYSDPRIEEFAIWSENEIPSEIVDLYNEGGLINNTLFVEHNHQIFDMTKPFTWHKPIANFTRDQVEAIVSNLISQNPLTHGRQTELHVLSMMAMDKAYGDDNVREQSTTV